MLKRGWRALDPVFPEINVYKQKLTLPVTIVLFFLLTLAFSVVGILFPANGFVGWDWVYFFGIQRINPFMPPWTIYTVQYLTWPLLVGITLSSATIATIKRSVHPISAALTLISFPLFWTVFLGQLEGISVLGLLGLPWLIPLALVKPQVSIFALGARRKYLIAFFVFLLISLLIWGNWPARMLAVESYYGEGRYETNIGMGLYGLPLFLLTVWFSRGDMDMLMASGAFVSPHILFYNLLPLTPSMARLKPRAAAIAWFFSYLSLAANWIGPTGWWLGWCFVLWLWINLAAQRYPENRFSRALLKLDHNSLPVPVPRAIIRPA